VQERSITTVLFDVGNTLTYVDLEAVLRPLTKRGIKASEAQYRTASIQARRAMDRLCASGQQSNPDAQYWKLFLDGFLEAVDVHDPEIASEMAFEWRSARNWTRMAPGTTDVLDRLAKRYELGVISNSDGTMDRLLKALGLSRYFRTIVDSGTVGYQKPSPEIFRRALESMGAEPQESVYVGDIYAVDYLGATGAGMHAVLIDELGTYDGLDLPRISKLAELEALLQSF
jgi:HAD superfamily hydrolase (TIGR01549 family)